MNIHQTFILTEVTVSLRKYPPKNQWLILLKNISMMKHKMIKFQLAS